MNMRFQQTLTVSWNLDLRFTEDVFAPENDTLADVLPAEAPGQAARVLVYIDRGVVQADPHLLTRIHTWFALREQLHLATLPEVLDGGEEIKNDTDIINRVSGTIAENHLCRHSYVIIIGGGAVLDAIGCAASLAHRGIRQVRLPTTVLAQNDAGLGVKNSLNRHGNKNFLGTFTPAWAIINDCRFLRALDDRTWRAGIAEAFKVALIKDEQFLSWLIAHSHAFAARDMAAMNELIQRCAILHLNHIVSSGDAFEMGSSRPLDFGHWSAHRLEILSRHSLNHGEAVAIGIALDCCYAAHIGRLPVALVPLILDALQQCGFVLWHEALDIHDAQGSNSVLAGIEQFREHLGGTLTLAMPNGTGQQLDIHDFDEAIFTHALNDLRTHHQAAQDKPTKKHITL